MKEADVKERGLGIFLNFELRPFSPLEGPEVTLPHDSARALSGGH